MAEGQGGMELSILVYVLLLIAFAKALGEAVSRLNQPPIVGELLAGIVLGPFVLGKIFSDLQSMYSDEFLSNLADLGILFLMLYVGLEFSPKKLVSSSWTGGVIAFTGISLPMVMGFYLGVLYGYDGRALVFLAVAMSVTALPVTLRILKDLEVLETKTSDVIISAALITDLALLFVMGVLLGGDQGSMGPGELLYLAGSFIGFFVLAFVIGRYAVPHIYRVLRWMRTGEAAFAVAIGIAMAFAVLAEKLGLPGFVGAFIAGLLLRETGTGLKVWARVEDILSGITLGFLAPVFFVLIGFSVDFDAVGRLLPLLVAVSIVAIVGKFVGSYVPARLVHIGRNESAAISSMMMGKGAMELVFARLALEMGIIDTDLFSVLVLMAFISTLLAPVLFKLFFNRAVRRGEIEGPSGRRPDPDLPIAP